MARKHGPGFTYMPGDKTNLEHIILDLSSRILNTGDTFKDLLPTDGSRPMTGDLRMGGNCIQDVGCVEYALNHVPTTILEGRSYWNSVDHTLNLDTGLGPELQAGQELMTLIRNNSGEDFPNGCAVYATGVLDGRITAAKALADTHVRIDAGIGITTMPIPDGAVGFVTTFGAVRGLDTTVYTDTLLYVSADVPGELTDVKPELPDYVIQIGGVTTTDAVNGVITVEIKGAPIDTQVNFFNGTFREKFDFTVTSNGTDTITGHLAPSNGHPDMTMMFSDGFTMLTTTPAATIELTAGTDPVPVTNYVYIPESTKVLTVSTSGWPTTFEHIKVAQVLLRTPAATLAQDALRNQNYNNFIEDTDTFQGQLDRITYRLRQEEAKWESGVELTVDEVALALGDVYVATTSGKVLQLGLQDFPAGGMPDDDIHIVNKFPVATNAYFTTDNLNTEVLDANGATLSNRSFSFVLWGVQNKTGELSHMMVNLPTGSYSKTSPDSSVTDALNYSVYDIPKAFQGVGFLVARVTFTLSTPGDTWALYEIQDLRGSVPNTVAGGGGSGGGGVSSFTALTDTPNSYLGEALKIPQVNAGETALEFTDSPTMVSPTITSDWIWINPATLSFGNSPKSIILGGSLELLDSMANEYVEIITGPFSEISLGNTAFNTALNLLGTGLTTLGGNLIVDGGDIGITTDTDLIQLATDEITVNGDLVVQGSVGIGTSPEVALHLKDGEGVGGTEFIVEETESTSRPAFFMKNDTGARAGFFFYGSEYSNVNFRNNLAISVDNGGKLLVNGGDLEVTFNLLGARVGNTGHTPVSSGHFYNNNGDKSSSGNGLTVESDNSGDAVLQFLTTGRKRWKFGLDYTNSNLHITDSSTLGSGDVIVFNNAGNDVTIPSGLRIGDTAAPADVLEVNGISTLGDGGTTNYTSISATGDVEPHGSATYKANGGTAGASGSFTTVDGKTVTVTGGLITAIV